MTVWTLIARALRTHRAAAGILALVIIVGSFLGAAAPRWIDDRLDHTLQDTIAETGSAAQLSARDTKSFAPDEFDDEVSQLRENVEPELAALLDTGRWSSHTGARYFATQNGAKVDDGLTPRRLDVWVPDTLDGKLDLIEGELPESVADGGNGTSVIEVAATPPVAEALQLDIGDTVTFERREPVGIDDVPEPGADTKAPAIRLTGLVEPADVDDPFWADTRTAADPDLGEPGAQPRITTGSLIAEREQFNAWLDATQDVVETEWHVPIDASEADVSAVNTVTTDLRRLSTGTMWASGLTDTLEDYPARRSAAEGVVGFGIVSLAALCVALTLLSVRYMAERRASEIALARTRGAGDGALARLLALDAAVIAVPGSVLGAAAAVALTSGESGLLGYVLTAAPPVAAIVSLPIAGIRAARRAALAAPGGERADVAAVRPSPRRLVAEASVVLVALLALWLAGTRQQGARIDPVVSLTPVLVAGATGLVIFRIMPFILAAALRPLRRSAALTGFLAVTRAARAPAHAVLPVIALLVAIGVATFGGTVEASVEQTRETSSWNEVTADAVIDPEVIRSDPEQVASVPGSDAIATGYGFKSQRPVKVSNGRRAGVDILAVDVPAWLDVAESAPQLPDVVSMLSSTPDSGATPAVLKGSLDIIDVGDQLEVRLGDDPVTVEVVGTLPDVPGTTSGTSLVMPLAPVAEAAGNWPDVVYVGGDVSAEALAGALDVDSGSVTLRSQVLDTIHSDTVLNAVLDVFDIVTAVSAGLAAAAAVLGLAVGGRSRAHGISVLRTLGLTTRQAAVLTASDIVPVSVLAAAAGVGVGTGVGLVIGDALDLRALSGALTGGSQVVSDLPGATIAAAVVLAVVVLAVAIAVVAARRTRLDSALRAGELDLR